MGEFPYTCEECGGAYKKCGKGDYGESCDDCGHHDDTGHEAGCKGSFKDCEGGQSCWQDEVVIKLEDGTILEGTYEGYGIVDVPNDPIEYVPIEFIEHIKIWELKEGTYKICHIWCKSCYVKIINK